MVVISWAMSAFSQHTSVYYGGLYYQLSSFMFVESHHINMIHIIKEFEPVCRPPTTSYFLLLSPSPSSCLSPSPSSRLSPSSVFHFIQWHLVFLSAVTHPTFNPSRRRITCRSDDTRCIQLGNSVAIILDIISWPDVYCFI